MQKIKTKSKNKMSERGVPLSKITGSHSPIIEYSFIYAQEIVSSKTNFTYTSLNS